MQPLRAAVRRRLDRRLAGLQDQVGPRPSQGWIRVIREALRMSEFELARRMGVTQSRVSQIERAEVAGSLLLSTLERAAAALNCRVCYVLVPNESLEQMVRRQARRKAVQEIAASARRVDPEDQSLLAELAAERVDALTHELVDSLGLWGAGTAASPMVAAPQP